MLPYLYGLSAPDLYWKDIKKVTATAIWEVSLGRTQSSHVKSYVFSMDILYSLVEKYYDQKRKTLWI